MSNKWHRWNSMRPVFQPSDRLDLLYIDDSNNIVNARELAGEINWHDPEQMILAWRLVAQPAPRTEPSKHLGTRYWNWTNSKWWPTAASRPPNPKLPYFRIEIWLKSDGTTKLEYFLPEQPTPPIRVNYTDRTDEA